MKTLKSYEFINLINEKVNKNKITASIDILF